MGPHIEREPGLGFNRISEEKSLKVLLASGKFEVNEVVTLILILWDCPCGKG